VRKGDSAELAVIELLGSEFKPEKATGKKGKKDKGGSKEAAEKK
jgi:hypothetical protein